MGFIRFGFYTPSYTSHGGGAALEKNVSVLIGREGGGYSPSTPHSGKNVRGQGLGQSKRSHPSLPTGGTVFLNVCSVKS